jgi:flagellar secretion chaperone FliS
MAVNYYDTYKQQEILTANRGELLLLLYDGCIKQLKLANLFMEEKSFTDSHNALMKSQAILCRLMDDLDMSYDISTQLLELYKFFNQEIVEANIKRDAARLKPIIDMLVDLRNTWQMAILSQKTTMAACK